MTIESKREIRNRLEELTGDDLKKAIYQISKIPFILLIYENNFDAEAHRNEMFVLYQVVEFLQEVEQT